MTYTPNPDLFLEPAALADRWRVETIADPFLLEVDGHRYAYVEIEGHTLDGQYFKQLGVFEIDLDQSSARFLSLAVKDSELEFSFPYLVWDGDDVLMVPDVQNGSRKLFRIYRCARAKLPLGWRLDVEVELPGSTNGSDKALVQRNGRWYLLTSSSESGGMLRLFHSADLREWEEHPSSPLLQRSRLSRLLNRILPYSWYKIRPWRLAGGPMEWAGRHWLPLQHMLHKKVYGEAVTLAEIVALTPQWAELRLETNPFMQADPALAWKSAGCHHLSILPGETSLVATDGFDGTGWRVALERRADPVLPRD